MKVKSLVSAMLSLTLVGCASSGSADTSSVTSSEEKDSYTVGILQLVQHPALDSASEGFQDTLEE